MFCTQCGTQVSDGVKFCPSCGNNLRADAGASKASPDSGARTPTDVESRIHRAQAAEPISLRADAQADARASAIAPRGRLTTAVVGGAIALILAAAGYWTWSNFAPSSGGGSAGPVANSMGQRGANVIAAPAPAGVTQPGTNVIAAPAAGGASQADAKLAAAAAPSVVVPRDAGVVSARDSGEQAEFAAARAALDREIAAEESEARERASRSAPDPSPQGKARQ